MDETHSLRWGSTAMPDVETGQTTPGTSPPDGLPPGKDDAASGKARGRIDIQQISLSIICLVFTFVVLIPVILTVYIECYSEYWSKKSPDIWGQMLIQFIRSSGDDFSKLTAFVTPFFAIMAGLKSRRGDQTVFFLLFVCLSLFGAIGSLQAKYFLLSEFGGQIFSGDNWLNSKADLPDWQKQVGTYFNGSFQTFLGFVSILLGLKAAGG